MYCQTPANRQYAGMLLYVRLLLHGGCNAIMDGNTRNVLLLIGSILIVLIACMGTVSTADIDDFSIENYADTNSYHCTSEGRLLCWGV